ncbi:hypothetical protein [Gilliamella intestini]|uniref:Uncharacterized protein n=1 Tax=Gilliamella intestini TaxID=1798183 RepID=A0A1C4D619_9GAMM|nr:hypothetical protein [Gilliamella intestini]SCC26746.1 hypothetical protein GA0061080_10609 [Gilliamella intestini]
MYSQSSMVAGNATSIFPLIGDLLFYFPLGINFINIKQGEVNVRN